LISVYTIFVLNQDKSGEFMSIRVVDSKNVNITGKRIREARLKAGLSQRELSVQLELKAVYICRGSLSRIETGERTVTDIELAALSDILNVSLNYLFGRE
jgi:ribosome-binding protein aMBF1 (putative translation factor)